MVSEAEQFDTADLEIRKRIEILNQLTNTVFSLENQIFEKDGWAEKIKAVDKETVQSVVKDAKAWIEKFGEEASTEMLEDKLAEVQSQVGPITSQLYEDKSSWSFHDDDL